MPKSSNNITDILFDLGNVLVPFDWDIAFRRLLPILPPDLARLLTENKRAFKQLFLKHSLALEVGEIDFESFCRIISETLRIQLNVDEFRVIWCDIFRIDEEMVALGECLSKNYRTWLVSNTCRAHYYWIVEHFPRVAFYRMAALSFELAVMKPSPAYYEKAIEMFGIDPASSVFIDDLWENVQGAERSGIRGILYSGRFQLIQDLVSLGVKVRGYGE
ncbi:MAG: HAD family phosphatase [Deltaproteobacteria bacterium]|jgi:putative hydrolase of the HAD superfamily|nr:HAD family phosphatase [Deltaproteobacteria bacterium]